MFGSANPVHKSFLLYNSILILFSLIVQLCFSYYRFLARFLLFLSLFLLILKVKPIIFFLQELIFINPSLLLSSFSCFIDTSFDTVEI